MGREHFAFRTTGTICLYCILTRSSVSAQYEGAASVLAAPARTFFISLQHQISTEAIE